jgi:hypothetical protein
LYLLLGRINPYSSSYFWSFSIFVGRILYST